MGGDTDAMEGGLSGMSGTKVTEVTLRVTSALYTSCGGGGDGDGGVSVCWQHAGDPHSASTMVKMSRVINTPWLTIMTCKHFPHNLNYHPSRPLSLYICKVKKQFYCRCKSNHLVFSCTASTACGRARCSTSGSIQCSLPDNGTYSLAIAYRNSKWVSW